MAPVTAVQVAVTLVAVAVQVMVGAAVSVVQFTPAQF